MVNLIYTQGRKAKKTNVFVITKARKRELNVKEKAECAEYETEKF